MIRGSFIVDRDHLRVCGADRACFRDIMLVLGSSPRVRSRRGWLPQRDVIPGIISACAEQTTMLGGSSCNWRDHLRVCGADITSIPSRIMGVGSSPRVRSRLVHADLNCVLIGIISACAEQTSKAGFEGSKSGDHLRVCGADPCGWPTRLIGGGSSPRVRSRQESSGNARLRLGIISACAEQTSPSSKRPRGIWDHLRVCGADPPL